MVWRSSTRRAIGPICQSAEIHPPSGGKWPRRGWHPLVGFRLAMPQKAAGAIAAQAHGRSARRDQRRFTAAAASRRARRVVWIVGTAEQKVIGFKGEQQVGKIGPGNRNRARRAQTSHQHGVLRGGRSATPSHGARGADCPRELYRILDAERYAVEGSAKLA